MFYIFIFIRTCSAFVTVHPEKIVWKTKGEGKVRGKRKGEYERERESERERKREE